MSSANVVQLHLPQLLTVADIRRLLQVGERQAYEIAHAAGAVRLGRSIRVRPADLDYYLDTMAAAGAKEVA